MGKTKGAIAAGSAETARAGAMILEAGGNAFDAAIAAKLMAFVSEPMMTAAGGGGFLTAFCADHSPVVFDFFTQTPKRRRPTEELDFFPVELDYGGVTQVFHVGLGSIAVPGNIAGLFTVHKHLGSMPFREIAAPAIEAAREGVPITPFFHYCYQLCYPCITSMETGRQLYLKRNGEAFEMGEKFKMPKWADTLAFLAEHGPDEFYRGEIAQQIVMACQTRGGHLTYEDMAEYRTMMRKPLRIKYRGYEVFTTPPPAAGGALAAYTLKLMEKERVGSFRFGSAEHLTLLVNAMRLTKVERRRRFDDFIYQPDVAERFFNLEDLAALQRILSHAMTKIGSTTHLTVADADGNVACTTSSLGEGSGFVLPGTDIMLNNMLGEEDLNPNGFHQFVADERLTSMMAPTIVAKGGHPLLAVGSGGANRIRSIVAQVVSNFIDFGMSPKAAIDAPRIHWENGQLNLEPGYTPEHVEDIYVIDPLEVNHWKQKAFFFGGAHSVFMDADGIPKAIGDSRRVGAAIDVR